MNQSAVWRPSDIGNEALPVDGEAPRRHRGRIPQSAWPLILEKHRSGVTLSALAREYECTPSAISYIVRKAEQAESGEGAEMESAEMMPEVVAAGKVANGVAPAAPVVSATPAAVAAPVMARVPAQAAAPVLSLPPVPPSPVLAPQAPVVAPAATPPAPLSSAAPSAPPPRQPLTVRNLGNGGHSTRLHASGMGLGPSNGGHAPAAVEKPSLAEPAPAPALESTAAAPAVPGRPQQPPPLDATDARLRDTAKACLIAYRGWKQGPADASAQALNESVHELRKVLARIEIDMAASRRDEQVARPIPIPAHRASRLQQR